MITLTLRKRSNAKKERYGYLCFRPRRAFVDNCTVLSQKFEMRFKHMLHRAKSIFLQFYLILVNLTKVIILRVTHISGKNVATVRAEIREYDGQNDGSDFQFVFYIFHSCVGFSYCGDTGMLVASLG